MTGEEFKDYVVAKFKRTDKNDELYQATTDTIADMRIQFNSEDYKEEAYCSCITTLGEYRLALPSDFGHIIGDITVIDTSTDQQCGVMTKVSKEEYDKLNPERLLTSTDNTGTPDYYCVYGGQIYVGPTPDSVDYKYVLNYTTEAFSEITAVTADVPFSGKYRNVLRCGVLAELHDGMDNIEYSQYWRGMYVTGLTKIRDNDENNTQDDGSIMYRGI